MSKECKCDNKDKCSTDRDKLKKLMKQELLNAYREGFKAAVDSLTSAYKKVTEVNIIDKK